MPKPRVAGDAYCEPVPTTVGYIGYLTHPDTGVLEKVEVLAYDGVFDGIPRYHYYWLSGPDTDTEFTAYGRQLWRKKI